MAVVMTLFASCTQDEIVSTSQVGDNMVRLSVNVSGAQPNTRAAQSLDVEGYTMRCIAQAVDESGTLIPNFTHTVAVTNGTAHFEFEAPEGAAKYVFWADYVSSTDESTFYNADDLTKVEYERNQSKDLFNNQAADAFCGNVAADGISGTINLKRPFTRIAVRQSQVENMELTGLTNITPHIYSGTDYNVATGVVTNSVHLRLNETEQETLTALTTDKNADFYFFCYAFAAPEAEEGSETNNTTILFNSETNTTGKTVTIEATDMQNLTANSSVILVPSDIQGTTINVDIEIDNGYGDELTLKVGAYINAAGEPVATAEEAVAVVFHMGAYEDDATSSYPEALQSKTIAGYAVALKNATGRVALLDGTNAAPILTATDNTTTTTAGYANSATFLNYFTSYSTSPLLNAWNTWLGNNSTNGNLSTWYIPTFAQLKEYAALAVGENADAEFATKITPQSFLTTPTGTDPSASNGWFFLSSSISEAATTLHVVTIGNGNNATAEASAYTLNDNGTFNLAAENPLSAVIRPVVTIFE